MKGFILQARICKISQISKDGKMLKIHYKASAWKPGVMYVISDIFIYIGVHASHACEKVSRKMATRSYALLVV